MVGFCAYIDNKDIACTTVSVRSLLICQMRGDEEITDGPLLLVMWNASQTMRGRIVKYLPIVRMRCI